MPDNRTRILACALQLFASRGYDAVGTQEIVDAAGVTKPTMYHYFGSKHGLLQALLDETFGALFAALVPAANYRGDLVLTLETIARAYFRFAAGHSQFYRMQLSMGFAPADSEPCQVVAVFHRRQYALIERMFEKAAADHGNMKGRHQAYAATFLGMLNTYISLSLNGSVELGDELVYRAVHQFMHGIFS